MLNNVQILDDKTKVQILVDK